MRTLSPQLTLGLHLQNEATFDHFHAGNNGEVVAALKKLVSGQGDSHVYLYGMRGEGRSHILQACCHQAEREGLRSAYLPLRDLLQTQESKHPVTPEMLRGFEDYAIVCLDDLQILAGYPEWEEAVFHLYNQINDANGRLIMTATDLPKMINLKLPDLVSRLTWGVIYHLQPLTDEEKLNILTNRAKCRGISLSEEVGRYMMTHCPRHMTTLCAALDALDRASLAAQRRLTIPFVKEVLQI